MASFQTLQKSFVENLGSGYKTLAIDDLKSHFQSQNGSDADKKAALDQSFRDVLVDLLMSSKSSLNVDLVEKFISFSVLACRSDMVSTTMPIVLLGDVFDSVTLDQCEKMFLYVEKNVGLWKEDFFFGPCKNNLLRMCNDLLRRLSRSQNTVFCGRILLFLAKFFPFSERSGLNIVSEFNLENLTEYDGGTDGKELPMGETTESTDNDAQLQVDFNLYCKFWALQDFFRNPNQCYTAAQWKTFSTYSGNVLAAFKSFKLEEHRNRSSRDKPRNGGGSANVMEVDMESASVENVLAEGQHFFAKFLTNPKLLSLQLSDSHFRRSVLVQFLILFQYLTSQVKFKAESLALTPAQTEWIKETEAMVMQLLEETPPAGKKFCASVRHILQREELWNNWKNDGCKEFKKPELGNNTSSAATDTVTVTASPLKMKRPKRLLGDVIRDATKNGKFFMGNAELTKLWNVCPDNLASCKGMDRNFMPNLETYLESDKGKGDASYEWRSLRLLARQSPHFFVANTPSSSTNKVSDFLENVRKRIVKERSEAASGAEAVKAEVHEEESVEMEQTEETMENEDEDQELMKQDEGAKAEEPGSCKPTDEQMKELSAVIADDWKKLGAKLGYASDEILFFESENALVPDQCLAMLRIWFDDDVDASWDNLAYTLEGLKMSVAAEVVKNFIPNRGMEDVSE